MGPLRLGKITQVAQRYRKVFSRDFEHEYILNFSCNFNFAFSLWGFPFQDSIFQVHSTVFEIGFRYSLFLFNLNFLFQKFNQSCTGTQLKASNYFYKADNQ